MPNTITRHVFRGSVPATVDALDQEIVRSTPGQTRFAGLLLRLPFSQRGSTAVRAEAKQRGARWDGSDWTLPPERYVRPACDADIQWFLSQNAVSGVLTREYTPWVWCGDNTQSLVLDVPFSQRVQAKSLGAVWNSRSNRWVIPVGRLTHSLVDELNRLEWIAGWESVVLRPGAGGAVNQAPAPAAPAPARPLSPVTGAPRGVYEMAKIRFAEKAAEVSRFAGAGGVVWGAEQSAHRDLLRRLRTHTGVYWLTGEDARAGRVLVMFADLSTVLGGQPREMLAALITERADDGRLQVDLRHPDAAEWTPADWAEHLSYSTVRLPSRDAAALYELMANKDGLRPITVPRDASGRANAAFMAGLAS